MHNLINRACAGVGLIMAICVAGNAQMINLTGTVADTTSSVGIGGATVGLVEFPQVTAVTTSNGSFTLTGKATGIVTTKAGTAPSDAISLKGNAISVKMAAGAGPIALDVFTADGSRIYHSVKPVTAGCAVLFANLPRTPKLYYINVKMNGKNYGMMSTGMVDASLSIAHPENSRLAKSAATYTLQVVASGYTTKGVAISTLSGNVGTILLSRSQVQTGVWTNVTPSGINLDPNFAGSANNYGLMDAIVDPVRPSDIYVFTCYQGVWKSTDFGVTWTLITAAGVMTGGRAWGEAIDPNPNRDPATPPTFYACQGYGPTPGWWKSTDGGVTWTVKANLPSTLAQDPYDFDIDPYDSNHIIAGFHELNGVAESTDGGATWRDATGNMDGGGMSWYVYFINTGNAATTRTTWLAISQATGGGAGTLRTSNSGGTWTKVESNEHTHGNCQIYQTTGIMYMCGPYGTQGNGIYRSTDLGQTWTHVGLSSTIGSSMFGTPNHVYCTSGGANQAGNPPQFAVGPANGLCTWTTPTTPAAFTNGPKSAAVTFDGNHYIIVGGCWLAGIWRYVEP